MLYNNERIIKIEQGYYLNFSLAFKFSDEISPGAVKFKPQGDEDVINIENGDFSWDPETPPQLKKYKFYF